MDANIANEFNGLLQKLLAAHDAASDVLLVVGKPPQVEIHGVLEAPEIGETVLTGERVEKFARGIINGHVKLQQDFASTGACDCSYALPDTCRFRVNVYKQNGQHAMVMRRLSSQVPTLDSLNLPPAFKHLTAEKNGLVFVTGGTGNGKTTTLAALLNEINATSKVHVVTLEDPIEFLHPQLKSTFSQRELGRDFFSFPDGLRSALRQAPKVILVGEIRDRETMEIALTAGADQIKTIPSGAPIRREPHIRRAYRISAVEDDAAQPIGVPGCKHLADVGPVTVAVVVDRVDLHGVHHRDDVVDRQFGAVQWRRAAQLQATGLQAGGVDRIAGLNRRAIDGTRQPGAAFVDDQHIAAIAQ